MNNNILRTAKVNSRAKITQAAEHNFRLRTQHNIDGDRTHLNRVLVNSLAIETSKPSDLQEKLTGLYNDLGIKERADNVLMMEFVVSASPEWFDGKKSSEIDIWANHQVDFFKQKFGDQLKIAVLHLDEKTPHLHFMVGTEMKSVKKYKNQKGEFFKETWSLNAKRYDKKFLIDLHTDHALHNKRFGLKRGVNGSMRKHTTLKEFYSLVNKAMSADYQKQIEKSIESLETGLLSGKVSIEEVREKFAPMVNKVLKQNKVLREKFAVDIKGWAQKLSEKEEEELDEKELRLEGEREKIAARRDVYVDAINRAATDAALIKELDIENSRLKAKVARYEPQNLEQQAFKDNSKQLPRIALSHS